jgi:hypothetical protein
MVNGSATGAGHSHHHLHRCRVHPDARPGAGRSRHDRRAGRPGIDGFAVTSVLDRCWTGRSTKSAGRSTGFWLASASHPYFPPPRGQWSSPYR